MADILSGAPVPPPASPIRLRADLDELIRAYARGVESYDQAQHLFESNHHGRIDRIEIRPAGAVVLWTKDAVDLHITPSRLTLFGRWLLGRQGRSQPQLEYQAVRGIDTQFAKTLFLVDQIIIEAKRTLPPGARRLCFEMVYSALTYLFKLASERPQKGAPPFSGLDKEAVGIVTDQLHTARMFHIRAAAQRSVTYYLFGMLVGIVVLLLAMLAIRPLLGQIPIANSQVVIGSVLAAGGIGAALSVMIRISRGQLSLAEDISRLEIVILGAFRPAVGVISALVLFLISNSGLLPLKVPDPSGPSGSVSAWYFYVTLAFLAGFSERLVPDTIVRAEGQLTTSSSAATRPPAKS